MEKKLAIRGHSTRGNEVIELLKMMGGKDEDNMFLGKDTGCIYYIDGYEFIRKVIIVDSVHTMHYWQILTFEEFLEKYPFKVGDRVFDIADRDAGIITIMKWDKDVSDMKYHVTFDNGDMSWYTNDTIEFLKEEKNMNKKLAIKGHSTRGKEVIELLEMMGGKNKYYYKCNEIRVGFTIGSDGSICRVTYNLYDEFRVFTLEEFLEKYPFKVGDKVFLYDNITEGCVTGMKWNEDEGTVKYCVYTSAECWCDVKELLKWNMILTNKETDEMKLSDSKCERTHEDAIFDSIIWHLRNSVNNGKQNLSAGECEDYFREVVKKNNENKMSDCKKCGLVFGSVRCFDKDCPYNTPKSYAVGLKDGKVIECGANKEIVMNENKPLFKTGDVVKLKGCLDKNLFWIVMDVIEDGYIFNDGKKYSFDEQYHYEKSNREVINIQPSKMKNVLAELLEHIKTTPKEELEREFEEIEEWSHVGPTIEEFMGFCDKVNKKPKYPKLTNLIECKEILGEKDMYQGVSGYRGELLTNFQRLLIFRDVYWKIAGEEMGLGKPWEPDWRSIKQSKFGIHTVENQIKYITLHVLKNLILVFPTEEMRDTFYENFKDLIEQCKELL